MTPIDSLYVGQWVAVCGDRQAKPNSLVGTLSFTGEPCKIEAISLPFICLSHGNHITTVDIRRFDLVRLKKSYVKKMTQAMAKREAMVAAIEEAEEDKPHIIAEVNCPICGNQLQECDDEDRTDVIQLYCEKCEFLGFLP